MPGILPSNDHMYTAQCVQCLCVASWEVLHPLKAVDSAWRKLAVLLGRQDAQALGRGLSVIGFKGRGA